jgi:hypothetical protein
VKASHRFGKEGCSAIVSSFVYTRVDQMLTPHVVLVPGAFSLF